jgi:adenylate cyclase
MLTISVSNKTQSAHLQVDGPIEFGRVQRRGAVPRFVIDDVFVSRDHLWVEELPDRRIQLVNLSARNPVRVADGMVIPVQSSEQLDLPVRLSVGETLIEIKPGSTDVAHKESMQTIAQPARSTERTLRSLRELGSSPDAESITHWLETVIALQRPAVGMSEFFDSTVRTLVDLIGLDLALVLLRRDAIWEVAARHATQRAQGLSFSHSLLKYVVTEQRTFYEDLGTSVTDSLRNISTAVVSPIFGIRDEVMGALYGVRILGGERKGNKVQPLEAQVVQLMAAAIGANLARVAATRTRVQFEQFFSPELVQELERDPDLLEGRDQEVTILVSDLRGFSGLAERLGPQSTCRLIRSMMEQFSEQIIKHGGVIVDYAGDGILAMWNAPVKQEGHAARAAQAALAMLDELPALEAQWQEVVGGPLRMGIGLNTGIAQVGNTGSSRKFKYGPHGHTVNLASRVQDATKQLGLSLVITGSTREGLPDSFATRRLCQARVQGMQNPVTLYELKGEPVSPEWLMRRDTYETALALYESGHWCKACQTLLPLLELDEIRGGYDHLTLKIMRRAWECLESSPDPFDPVLELGTK